MIEIINLFKKFNSHQVLNGVNLTIKDGETMVVIGRSGGGKSVLLKHIIGLMQPDQGQVIVSGQEVSHLKGAVLSHLRLQFGMLFQGAALFDSLSVGENVAFPLWEHTSMNAEQIRERVRECLAHVGLKDVEEMKPAELSGGMR